MKGLLLAIALASLAIGCESKSPFKNNVDEYRYLRSLSNPTPEQWRRKQELADMPSDVSPDVTVHTSAGRVDALEGIGIR